MSRLIYLLLHNSFFDSTQAIVTRRKVIFRCTICNFHDSIVSVTAVTSACETYSNNSLMSVIITDIKLPLNN